MKVKKFIKLLNQENKDAEIIAYLANKKGWQMAELGYNDAILGKTKTGKKDEIEDDLLVKIIAKLNKQRIDAYDIYKEQNREDLAEEELLQSNIYKEYLPKPVSDEELKAQINSIISNLGASGMKDMGRVMGVAMKNLGGKADGSKISSLVKALLS